MKVLVTGASGFTGGHLARRLKNEGHNVRVLARQAAVVEQLRITGYEAVQGDLIDVRTVDSAVAGCELLFHVAALYRSDKLGDKAFFDVNVGGTHNLLESAKRHGVKRFIHVSTAGVHGRIANPPADEQALIAPRDAYQQSKSEGENLARQYFNNGLSGVIVRPVGIFGPGDTRFLKLFRAIARKRFIMLGSGKALYHMTYIDNLIDGLLLCATHPQALGETFIIAGSSATTIEELVRRIAKGLGAPEPKGHLPLLPFKVAAPVCQAVCRLVHVEPPLYPRRLEFFTDDRSFTIAKASRVLGYEPHVSLDEGIARTIAWYRAEGWL